MGHHVLFHERIAASNILDNGNFETILIIDVASNDNCSFGSVKQILQSRVMKRIDDTTKGRRFERPVREEIVGVFLKGGNKFVLLVSRY